MSPKLGAMTVRKPYCCSAQGACSRDEPEPKLRPEISTLAPAYRGWFSTKSGFGEPSGSTRQSKKRPFSKPVRAMLLRNCLGMIWSVSTSTRSSGEARPVWRVKGSISSVEVPISNIDEVSVDRRRRGHRRADQMGATALALAALKVAVRGAGAALARLQDVRIHAQAHAATGFAPLEAGVGEHAVEALQFSGHLHLVRAWHDHRPHAGVDVFAADDPRRGPQVLEPGIGARPDEDPIQGDVLNRRQGVQVHIAQRLLE